MKSLLHRLLAMSAIAALVATAVCAAQCDDGSQARETTKPVSHCHPQPAPSKSKSTPECKHRTIESDRAERVLAHVAVDQLPVVIGELAVATPIAAMQGFASALDSHSPPDTSPHSVNILRI